jgi:hypothetical protein
LSIQIVNIYNSLFLNGNFWARNKRELSMNKHEVKHEI